MTYNASAFILSQRGNVLFIILIAIVLFSALSYVVSDMMRGGGHIGTEKARISTADILTYAHALREAVNMMRISNGCTEAILSFERAPFDGSDAIYVNAASPADFACHVFHPQGGGVAAYEMDPEIFDQAYQAEAGYGTWIISGAGQITGLGSDSNAELILALPFLKQSVCAMTANRIGQAMPLPVDTNGITLTTFTGTYAASSLYDNVDDLTNGCIHVTGGATAYHYTFFSTLHAR